MEQIEIVEMLKQALSKGAVEFVFIKKDGTMREAHGTLNLDLIPEEAKQFATPEDERKERTGIVTYYDLDKNAWRSCREENIYEIH